MNTLHFGKIFDFCEFLIDKYASLDFDDWNDSLNCFNVIGNFEQIKEIVEYLVCEGFPIQSIEMENPVYNGYHNDFVLAFDEDGIDVEPTFRADTENGYFYVDGKATYVIKPSEFPLKYANNGVFGKDSFGLHYIEIGECEKCDGHCHDEDTPNAVAAEAVQEAKGSYESEKNDDGNVIKIKIIGLEDLPEKDRKEKVDMAVENIHYLLDLFDSFDRHSTRRHYSYF